MGSADGKVETVRYPELIPMLLHETLRFRVVMGVAPTAHRADLPVVGAEPKAAAEVTQLRSMFEQTMAAENGTNLASVPAFNR